jgi:hypothetical protein
MLMVEPQPCSCVVHPSFAASKQPGLKNLPLTTSAPLHMQRHTGTKGGRKIKGAQGVQDSNATGSKK